MLQKTTGNTSLLGDIPCEVLGEVFRDWLDIRSLASVDCAVCNRETRPLLHKVFASNHCILGKHKPRLLGAVADVKWCTKRRVQLERIELTASSHELSKYLRLFSKSVLYVCCQDSDAIDLVAVSCRNLESFACRNMVVRPNLSAVLELNANLKELRLELVQGLIDKHFEELTLPHLVLLSLQETVCDDALLTSIVRATKKLQHVQIGKCHDITDDGLIALAQHCPLLKSVGLFGIHNNDGALKELAKHCPLIENLDLEGNSLVTDAGIFSVAKHLRQLQYINLSDCINLTDVSLEHLTQFSAKTLQWLHIVEWPQVRVDVLVRLLQQCNKLQTLCLDCDIDLYCVEVVPYMHNLRRLLVFAVLSDNCLCLIARHCKQLEALGIPCSYKVDFDLAAAAHQSAIEVGEGDVRLMHCADVEADDDDIRYTEKGLLALMEGLPKLRMLEGSAVSCGTKNHRCSPACWQRHCPGIQFKQHDSSLDFDLFHDLPL